MCSSDSKNYIFISDNLYVRIHCYVKPFKRCPIFYFFFFCFLSRSLCYIVVELFCEYGIECRTATTPTKNPDLIGVMTALRQIFVQQQKKTSPNKFQAILQNFLSFDFHRDIQLSIFIFFFARF